jgi:hypothetical protein
LLRDENQITQISWSTDNTYQSFTIEKEQGYWHCFGELNNGREYRPNAANLGGAEELIWLIIHEREAWWGQNGININFDAEVEPKVANLWLKMMFVHETRIRSASIRGRQFRVDFRKVPSPLGE